MGSGGDSCMPYVEASRDLLLLSKESINIQHQFLLSTTNAPPPHQINGCMNRAYPSQYVLPHGMTWPWSCLRMTRVLGSKPSASSSLRRIGTCLSSPGLPPNT